MKKQAQADRDDSLGTWGRQRSVREALPPLAEPLAVAVSSAIPDASASPAKAAPSGWVDTPWGRFCDRPLVRQCVRFHAFKVEATAVLSGVKASALDRTQAADRLAKALDALESGDLGPHVETPAREWIAELRSNEPMVTHVGTHLGQRSNVLYRLDNIAVLQAHSLWPAGLLTEAETRGEVWRYGATPISADQYRSLKPKERLSFPEMVREGIRWFTDRRGIFGPH